MFTAQGYIGRTAYTAVVGAKVPEGAESIGLLTGSPIVRGLLGLYDGQPVQVTPTGPVVHIDKTDERSIAALLLAQTEVVASDGMPDILGPDVAGAVY